MAQKALGNKPTPSLEYQIGFHSMTSAIPVIVHLVNLSPWIDSLAKSKVCNQRVAVDKLSS